MQYLFNHIGLITVTSISIIFIVGMYSYIFSETRRQRRSHTEHLSAEEIATIRRNNRATRTLGIVLGTLLATYLPTIIFIIMYYSVNVERRVLNCIASWVATLTILGALCNPVVYCWRKEEFRQAFLKILHLTSQENNQPQEAIEMQVEGFFLLNTAFQKHNLFVVVKYYLLGEGVKKITRRGKGKGESL